MYSHLRKLSEAMDHYIIIQNRHICAFEKSLLPDIASFNFERDHAFSDLKNNLVDFINSIQYDENFEKITVVHYVNRLESIMVRDEQLKDKIKNYRAEIKKHLCCTGKNRNAFHGYVNSTPSSNNKMLDFWK